MPNYKIVVTGTYAAGKSQFIRNASEIEPVETEVPVTDPGERAIKTHTTVGLDFGTLRLDDRHKLFLFGTPGQERFDFLWEQLAIGCLGYVVLVDSCRPADFRAASNLIRRFAYITPAPFVVAANKQDDPSALPPEYIHRRLGLPMSIPVRPCVARDMGAVHAVLFELLERIEALSVRDSHASTNRAA
ncbi:MAG: GTP-binding protein [Chloroflexales bacterium]|nr:GTP-binding protein [Chloroflexales bacterium]